MSLSNSYVFVLCSTMYYVLLTGCSAKLEDSTFAPTLAPTTIFHILNVTYPGSRFVRHNPSGEVFFSCERPAETSSPTAAPLLPTVPGSGGTRIISCGTTDTSELSPSNSPQRYQFTASRNDTIMIRTCDSALSTVLVWQDQTFNSNNCGRGGELAVVSVEEGVTYTGSVRFSDASATDEAQFQFTCNEPPPPPPPPPAVTLECNSTTTVVLASGQSQPFSFRAPFNGEAEISTCTSTEGSVSGDTVLQIEPGHLIDDDECSATSAGVSGRNERHRLPVHHRQLISGSAHFFRFDSGTLRIQLMCFEEDRRSRRDAKHASSDAKSQVVVTKPSMTVVSGDSRTTLPSLKAIGPTASLAGRRRRQLLSMGCGDVRRVFVAAGSVSNMSFFTPTTLGVVHLDTCMTRADTVLHVYGIAYDANEHCGSDELLSFSAHISSPSVAELAVGFRNSSEAGFITLRITCPGMPMTGIPTNITCHNASQQFIVPGGTATWSFTAPATGTYAFDTCSSGKDTVTTIASTQYDTDDCGILNERISTILVAGQTILMDVALYSASDLGFVVLNAVCPTVSQRSTPRTIACGETLSDVFVAAGATTPVSFVSPFAGSFSFETCGSRGLDTILEHNGNEVDDDECDSNEILTASMTSETTQTVDVRFWSGTFSGMASVTLSCSTSTVTSPPRVTADSREIQCGQTLSVNISTPGGYQNFTWTAVESGTMTIDTCLSGANTVLALDGGMSYSHNGRFDVDNCGTLNEQIVAPMDRGSSYSARVQFYASATTGVARIRLRCSQDVFTTPSVTAVTCNSSATVRVIPGDTAAIVLTAPTTGSFTFNTCATGVNTVVAFEHTFFDMNNCGSGNEQSTAFPMIGGESYSFDVSFFSSSHQGEIELGIECFSSVSPTVIPINQLVAIPVPVHPFVAAVQWTIPVTGNYTVATCGSLTDTMLEFRGLQHDDDRCATNSERVTEVLEGNSTYVAYISTLASTPHLAYFSVNESVLLTGTGTTAELAAFITTTQSPISGTTNGAIDTAGNPAPDFWYTFVQTTCATVTISTCDTRTNYDSFLRLYKRAAGGLVEIASNDDFCELRSRLSESLDRGGYVIQVEGFSSSSGSYLLDISSETVNCSDTVAPVTTTSAASVATPQEQDGGVLTMLIGGEEHGIIMGSSICDGVPDCANSADEDTVVCRYKEAHAAEIGAQATIPPRPSDADIAVVKSQVLQAGANGEMLVLFSAIIMAVVVIYYFYNCYQQKRALHPTRAGTPNTSRLEKYPWKRVIGKIWNLMWEFKALPIIEYSFFAMLVGVLENVVSQGLPNSCLVNVAERRYNTTAQCSPSNPDLGSSGFLDLITGLGTCDGVGVDNTLSECKESLMAEGKTKLFGKMIKKTIEGVRCSCTIEDEERAQRTAIVWPFVAAIIVAHVLLLLEVLWESQWHSRTFGTVSYFTAMANAKRSTAYLVLLLCSVGVLFVSLYVLVNEIEGQVREGLLTNTQYDNAYLYLASGFLLQLLALSDLWANIPASISLALFQSHYTVTFQFDGSLHVVPMKDLLLHWSWFMTSRDSVEMAENGMLFFLLAQKSGMITQEAFQNEIDGCTTCFGWKGCNDHWQPKDVHFSNSTNNTTGHVHGLVLAQGLAKKYFKGYVCSVAPTDATGEAHSPNSTEQQNSVLTTASNTQEHGDRARGSGNAIGQGNNGLDQVRICSGIDHQWIESLVVRKPRGESWGFDFDKDDGIGFAITSIQRNGVFARNGFKVGDIITEVGNQRTETMTAEEFNSCVNGNRTLVIEFLRRSPNSNTTTRPIASNPLFASPSTTITESGI
eukprot:m.1322806 g.1322806  ORF g.1322806 m.1322806 type:complete len:1810 (+) comp24848_c1_seq42:102-5531(+)